MKRLDPDIRCNVHVEKLTADNVDMITGYDIVADGTDNFRTRFLLNDACVRLKRTLVSSALLRFDGQISVYKPHAGEAFPCYRCVFPDEPPADLIPRCQTAGIFGAVAGIMGTLQATEIIKELLGLGDTLAGRVASRLRPATLATKASP